MYFTNEYNNELYFNYITKNEAYNSFLFILKLNLF